MNSFSKSVLAAAAIAAAFFVAPARAQIGDDNITGVAGSYNGDITTGCNYDAYTGNARRQVTDLVVNGSVSAYPLAFTRISTSRYDATIGTPFGDAGSWRHSYQYSIETFTDGTKLPSKYSVNFPDGRHISVTAPWYYPYFHRTGVREWVDVPQAGMSNPPAHGDVYLILPDGGRVWFSYDRTPSGTKYKFNYTLKGIIDPYGQQITVDIDPTTGNTTCTEPGGRSLTIYKRNITNGAEGVVGDRVVDRVEASDGRVVRYTYAKYNTPNNTKYTSLIGVTYFGDQTLQATYAYQNSNVGVNSRPLLLTCDDPFYPGPMRKIAYEYATGTNGDGSAVVAGQIHSEKSWTDGPAVSTLTKPTSTTRKETRGDGKERTFTYDTSARLTGGTDFLAKAWSQTYDQSSFVNSTTDFNGNTTNWTSNSSTGLTETLTHPATPSDVPPGTPAGKTIRNNGGYNCTDPNNGDINFPYWLCSNTDEGNNATTFLRDSNHRIQQINYPDGGTESFTYNAFGQVLTHTLKTGGTESWSYDARGLKTEYRDAYHDPIGKTGNPTFRYHHDAYDRVDGVTDALGTTLNDPDHTTNFTYNARGQVLVTTKPTDPVDSQRHTIVNTYNPDGTLKNVTDELGHITEFTYDDYRRTRTVKTPGHNTELTAQMSYGANYTDDDYTFTDSNVTHTTSPGGKHTVVLYDDNRRRKTVTIGDTTEAATTSYGYDDNGNVTSVVLPNQQAGQLYAGKSTATVYDERNRVMSITDARNGITTFKYDAAGRKASVTRANGQLITYDIYDPMNRLLQQTVKQTPDPDAVTKYSFYTSGLLHTMQDPRLVANSSAHNYNYVYDLMGRKTSLTYPPDSIGVLRTETWHYDTAGHNDTFTNRAGSVETLTYDALNRLTNLSWDDGATPSVTTGYDVASRVTSIVNANATITRNYYNDNQLNAETTTYADNTPRTVTYVPDADGNRASIQYPASAYTFTYDYTTRNQLWHIYAGGPAIATYTHDVNGNLGSRTLDNGTSSNFGQYDELDRVKNITHSFVGDTRTFDYDYDNVGNRKWVKRDGNLGDAFGYDLNDQANFVTLDVSNPDQVSTTTPNVGYDANGNRTTFSAYGLNDTYTTNDVNQYTARNTTHAIYDANGNLVSGLEGSAYVYDAQNRLTSATKGTTTEVFRYDGLNRQVSRTIGTATTYNVYDGWNLIGEYVSGATSPSTAYLPGVKILTSNNYYYQDASGSTSHLGSNTGALLEWYRYDLQGTPFVYAPDNSSRGTDPAVRHLFTGQQWYSELALYDLRNRFYSPDTGRFVQVDPIGFAGDSFNLYRYCQNNTGKWADPNGEFVQVITGALIGGGVDLGIQLWANGGNWGAVSWTQVGIQATAGAITGGVSSVVEASALGAARGIAAATTRIAINAASNAAANAGAQAAMNAVNGTSGGVGKQAAIGAVAGSIGGVLTQLANSAEGAFASGVLRAGAFAIENGQGLLGILDASTVEKNFTGVTDLEHPVLSQDTSGDTPFSVNLSLQNFGGAPFGGFSPTTGFGSPTGYLPGANGPSAPSFGPGAGGWPFGGDGAQVLVGDEASGCPDPAVCGKKQK
jgi:RHS repeat-associated protein